MSKNLPKSQDLVDDVIANIKTDQITNKNYSELVANYNTLDKVFDLSKVKYQYDPSKLSMKQIFNE